MKIAFFGTHRFEREIFEKENLNFGHLIEFFEPRLKRNTATLANGFDAVCSFVNDKVDAETIGLLRQGGVRLIATRSAGFNHIDLIEAEKQGITVVRVPEYSPFAVAEHAVCLLLALNRKIHRAYARVREANFSLDGLIGFDLNGKTVGVLGTGKIGRAFARIMHGFGCEILAYDLYPSQELITNYGAKYVTLEQLYRHSDIISLHIPLVLETWHLINRNSIGLMKPGVIVINTGRGALIDTGALIEGLKSKKIGGAGLDVYEEEEKIFFKDLSGEILKDDQMARLLTFPNVVVTAHQGFLTVEALTNIANTTLQNVTDFEKGVELRNIVRAREHLEPVKGHAPPEEMEPGKVAKTA